MVDLTKVDRNKPRFMQKHYDFLRDSDFIERLYKEYPELTIYNKRQIINIIKRFNTLVGEIMLTEREGISLPELGNMFIGIFGHKHNHPNFSHPDSGNMNGRVFYIHKLSPHVKHPYPNSQFWGFEPCKALKQGMAKVLTENWRNFIVMKNPKYTDETVRKELYKNRKKKETARKLKDYDEFKV